jgi:hypothetical protein
MTTEKQTMPASSYNFQQPALGQGGDAYELLPKILTAQTEAHTGETIFWGQNIPGVRYLPATAGGAMQTIFNSTMTQAYAIRPGEGKGRGGSSARTELITPRVLDYIEQKITYSRTDLTDVPAALQRASQDSINADKMIRHQFDRQVLIAALLAARQPSLTSSAATGSLPFHAGGSVVRKSGGSAVPATALNTRYPTTTAGGQNVVADVKELVRAAEDKGLDLNNAQIYLHMQLFQALMENELDKIFSRDYIDEQVGNSIVRRTIYRFAGVQVAPQKLRFANFLGGTGHLPNLDLTAVGASDLFAGLPSGLRANFLPTSTTGMPVALIMGENPNQSDAGAVHVMIHEPMQAKMIDDVEEYNMRAMKFMRATIAPINPVCAFSLELTSS